MNFITVFLLGLSLSLDAFAVAVSSGIAFGQPNTRAAIKTGVFFGGFQGLMPIFGYILAMSVAGYIEAFDHWIAMVLLAFLGIRMIWENLSQKSDEQPAHDPQSTKWLFLMAITTSIDALAAGITIAFNHYNIWLSALVIALITFAMSVAGVLLGFRLGRLFSKRAGVIGGMILIALGIKVVFDHLFFA